MRTIHSKKGRPVVRHRRTRGRARAGLTLIEVVASLGIIGLGIVGILALFPVAIEASARATNRTAATLLGQYVIDQVRLHQDKIRPNFSTARALKADALNWVDYADRDGRNFTFNSHPGGRNFGSGEQIVRQLSATEINNGPDDDPPGLLGRHTYSRFEVAIELGEALDEGGSGIGGFTSGNNKYLMQVTVTIRWPRAYSTDARRRQNTMTFVTYIRPQL